MNFLADLTGIPFAEYSEWEARFNGSPLGGAAVVAVALLALVFFRSSLARVRSSGRRFALLGLLSLVFCLLFLLLLQPEVELKESKLRRNSVAILIDDSKSMTVKAFPGEKPRFDMVSKVLKKNQPFFDALKASFDAGFYFFSDHVTEVADSEIEAKYHPAGTGTDFNRVLREVAKLYEDKPLQGVLLFSDGGDLNEAPDAVSAELAATLGAFKARIFAFQAGSNENFKDLGIAALDAPDFGFLQQPVVFTAHFNATGLGKRNVPVIVKEDDKLLLSRVLAVEPGETRYRMELQFTPASIGKSLYTVSAPLLSGESIEVNNRREFPLKTVRDRVRVLHLNGRPSWDSRFLREVLASNPKVDLLSFFILRTLSDDVAATTSELSLIPFPSNLLLSDYLSSFDLVIFHNFKFAPFIDKKNLENIRKFVEKGGAFIMIGGELSFQEGNYAGSPVESILPVAMKSAAGQFVAGELNAALDKKNQRHPLLRLEKNEEANREAWRILPRLHGMNTGLEAAEDAQVLIAHGQGKDALPVLAVRRVGDGRSMILATDSVWNWNFLKVGEGGSGRYYQKFWNNVIAWMTDPAESQLAFIETDKEKYMEGEKALIKARVLLEDYNPAPDEKIKLRLRSLPSKKDVAAHDLVTDKAGEADFEFAPPAAGFYAASLERSLKGRVYQHETRFSVLADTAEFDKPLVNDFLLRRIAEITGGAYAVLREDADLSGVAVPNPEIRSKTKSKVISLWDNWWSYGAIIGCLGLDWLLRRRAGLS